MANILQAKQVVAVFITYSGFNRTIFILHIIYK